MCRFFVAIGAFSPGEILEALGALREAARHDPYGEALYGESSHGDGWGLFLAALDGSRSLHYRSLRPIYEEDPWGMLAQALPGAPVILMAHARAASEGTPKDLASTHPVHARSRWGDLYLVHNGSFAEGPLEAVVGRWPGPHNDTALAAAALASRIGRRISRQDLEWLLGAEASGANLGIALLGEGIQVVVGSHYRLLGDGRDEHRSRYYRVYRCEYPGGQIYASSTIAELHLRRPCVPMGNGEFHVYEGSGLVDKWVIGP